MLNLHKKLLSVSLSLCLLSSSFCFGLNYKVQDLHLSASESYAVSLSNGGAVAGKIKQEKDYYDFTWTPERGVVILPNQTSTSLPVMNPQGEMASVYWTSHPSWLNWGLVKHFYTLDLKSKVKNLSLPAAWKRESLESWQTPGIWDANTLAVYAMTDHHYVLVADHFDPTRAKKFAVWHPDPSFWEKPSGKFQEIDKRILSQAWLMNNQGIILGKHWENNEQGLTRDVILYDLVNKTVTPIFKDAGYTLTGFNDKGQICGWKIKSKSQIEGFLWDAEKGLQSLGNFIPHALNNHGQMVGNLTTDELYVVPYYSTQHSNAILHLQNQKTYSLAPCIWHEGEVHLLESCIDLENLPWTTILSLNAINDRGEILGQAILDNSIQTILLAPLSTD